MKPILFEIWGIKVYGYGTMIAIGIIVAVMLFSNRAKKKGYEEEKILDMSILAIALGVVGGKLLYIITDIKNITTNAVSLKEIGMGFVVYGSIIGGVLGAYLYCRMKKWKALKVFDIVIPSLPLAQGFGRIGCFLAGCCYGAETTSSLSVVFKEKPFSLAPTGIHLHPTQIYSSIFDFLLAAFLLWYSKKERKDGRIFSMYLIIYSIGRFCVEFLRNDPRGSVGLFSTSQFISLFTLIIGVVLFNLEKIKKLIAKDNKEGREISE